MGHSENSKIPYNERDDDQRLESNWKKARKQFERSEWSACILRAATSAEISANIYIRKFLLGDFSLPPEFVDAQLLNANGLPGKFYRLVKPASNYRGTSSNLSSIEDHINSLSKHRNNVIHSGEFKDESEAKSVFESSLAIIEMLAPEEAAKLQLPYTNQWHSS